MLSVLLSIGLLIIFIAIVCAFIYDVVQIARAQMKEGDE